MLQACFVKSECQIHFLLFLCFLLVGVVEVFLMTFITLVCFFHISLLFYDIVFPLRAEKSKKYFKWVHLTLLIFGE